MEPTALAATNRNAFQTHHPEISLSAPAKPNSSLVEQTETPLPLSESQIESVDFIYWWGLDSLSTLRTLANDFLQHNKGILIIEPSWERVHAVMEQTDLRPWVQNQRVFWALGDSWKEQVQRVLDESLCFAANAPYQHVARTEACDSPSVEWLKSEISSRKVAINADLDALKEHVPSSCENGLKIWSFEDLRSIASYTTIQHTLMRSFFHELRKKGHTVDYVHLRPGRYYPPYYRILRLAQFRPDAIFLCNQSPSYDTMLGKELTQELKIPTVVWYADDPFYAEHLLKRNGLSPREYFLMADYEWFHTLHRYKARSVNYMPGAVTSMRRGYKRARHQCELVFVGQVRDLRPFFEQLPPQWRNYCEQIIREKLRFPRKNVRQVMQQFPMPAEIPADHEDDLRQKILWEANTRFRLRIVEEASRYDFHLFGNEAWKSLLPEAVSKRIFRGVLQRKRLFTAYRNARIVLNIHSLQSNTCLNVRDFDVAAAGGFLLSDWLPRAEEIATPGFADHLPLPKDASQELFFYRNLKEMHTLIEYFLPRAEERQACIQRARERFAQEHTYAHRAQVVHETLQRATEECRTGD